MKELREHTLVIGGIGMGKTHYLKQYAREHKAILSGTPRTLLYYIAKSCGPAQYAWSSQRLLESIRTRKRITVCMDDIDEVAWQGQKLLARLGELENITIIATAKKPPRNKRLRWLFRKKIFLKSFTRAQVERIIGRKHAQEAFLKTRGVPLAVLDLKRRLEKDGRKALDELPHQSAMLKRIDVLPMAGLLSLAYVFLAFRYLALGYGDREMFMALGFMGFIVMAMGRRR